MLVLPVKELSLPMPLAHQVLMQAPALVLQLAMKFKAQPHQEPTPELVWQARELNLLMQLDLVA